MAKKQNSWIKFTIIFLIVLFILSLLIASIIGALFNIESSDGNVALIPIKGTISVEPSSSFGSEGTTSDFVVDTIKKADANPRIKAIVFEINSGGGSAVASDEIGQAIKLTNKTTVAWIREVGASGAYWIASNTDHIVANRMSITGSIGVIGSYLDFSGLMQDFNVTYERLVSGKYKDIGSPFKELTLDEEIKLQKLIDSIHEEFVKEVSTNRHIPKDDVEDIATGLIYLGSEAKDLGLVDQLGGEEEVKNYLENSLNITIKYIDYQPSRSFFQALSSLSTSKTFSAEQQPIIRT